MWWRKCSSSSSHSLFPSRKKRLWSSSSKLVFFFFFVSRGKKKGVIPLKSSAFSPHLFLHFYLSFSRPFIFHSLSIFAVDKFPLWSERIKWCVYTSTTPTVCLRWTPQEGLEGGREPTCRLPRDEWLPTYKRLRWREVKKKKSPSDSSTPRAI